MADQDRFIVSIVGTGQTDISDIQSQFQAILRQTQFDFSEFHIVPYGNGNVNEWLFNVTTDDVFQGNAANVQTVKDQFDAVMRQYFSMYESSVTGSQVIPAHHIVTDVNPNTGHITTQPQAPLSPTSSANPTGKNWFDRTFFTGAGTLTGAAVGVLLVLGAVVVTQRRN